MRGAGLEGPFALPAAAARAQAATDRLADAIGIASEQLRRTRGAAAQRPSSSPGGAADGAGRRPPPSRQRQRRRLPEALEEL